MVKRQQVLRIPGIALPLRPMKTPLALLFAFSLSGSALLASDLAPRVAQPQGTRQELTLLANPTVFPAAPTESERAARLQVLRAKNQALLARAAELDPAVLKLVAEREARAAALRAERTAPATPEQRPQP